MSRDAPRHAPSTPETATQPSLAVGRGRSGVVPVPLQLVVASSPDPNLPVVLDVDARGLALGRDPPRRAARQVVDDACVSRLHVVVTAAGDGRLVVRDQASRNGLRVNGRPVAEAFVGEGDVVRLGDTVLLATTPRPRHGEGDDLGLVGRTHAVVDLRRLVDRVAPSRLPVLVEGPTGSGKELVARAVHLRSGRRGPFVALNCAALPVALVESMLFGHKRGAFTSATADQDGAFAQAHGGTLFLDEIGDMPLEVQPKLLRVLETGEVAPLGAMASRTVDVRVVAASHVRLQAAVAEGRFREDLLGRLEGVVLRVPPLSDRKDDVLPLVRHFLGARRLELSADVAEALLVYGWPRNVRELRNVVERFSVLHPDAPTWTADLLDDGLRLGDGSSGAIEAAAFPRSDPARPPPPGRDTLVALLDAHGGNVSAVAAAMGRNRKQVYRWMQAHGLPTGVGRA